VKITLESNIALGVQQTLGLLEQQTSLLIAMEFLCLRPAKFSSNRNVAFMLAVLDHPELVISARLILLHRYFGAYSLVRGKLLWIKMSEN